jgi:hypothetical protein
MVAMKDEDAPTRERGGSFKPEEGSEAACIPARFPAKETPHNSREIFRAKAVVARLDWCVGRGLRQRAADL